MRYLLIGIMILLNTTTNAQCERTYRPVVFVHGFLASGDTWANAVHFFRQAGYCSDRLFAFDWNSVGTNNQKNELLLARFIEQVLANTGASQIDLVGHSAGGGLARNYIKDSTQAKKVAHYIHIGSRKWTGSYSWFPNDRCLNIYSAGDRVAAASAGPIEGAANLALTSEDHYEVATSTTAVKAMLAFIEPGAQNHGALKTTKKVAIAGKAVLLGDNQPLQQAQISIYRINKNNGTRKDSEASFRVQTSETGAWGPVLLKSGVPYEIELTPREPGKRKIAYFFGSFDHADPLVYLRGFPEGNMMASLLGSIPSQPTSSALVVYSATRAMIGGRDSVSVNGTAICSEELTPASKTVISSFVFEDGDQKSTGQSMKQFGRTPFVGGVDLLLPAGVGQYHTVFFNGKTLRIPARSSVDQILLAVVR